MFAHEGEEIQLGEQSKMMNNMFSKVKAQTAHNSGNASYKQARLDVID